MTQNKVYIYGKHVLAEALSQTPQAIEEIFMTPKFDDENLMALARKLSIKTSVLAGNKLPREVDPTAAHQGIVGLLSFDRLARPYGEFIKVLKIGPDTSLVLLGGLSDPQNVGAVIRSAAAFGLSGVLIPEHDQVQITGAVVKVSAGMAFRIPLVSIGNINTVARDLKEHGFAVYGLSGGAKYTVTKEPFDRPTVFILGNEATGIREKTRELCDKLLSIPINPRCESLNAAAAAAAAFYGWSVKHPEALKA